MALFKLIGQGVGLAAEYRSHRQQQNQAREAAQQESRSRGASPVPPVQQGEADEAARDLPPTYAESAQGSERSLAGGQQVSANEKGMIPRDEDDSDFDSDGSTLLDFEDDEGDWELDDLERDENITPPGSTVGLPSYEESEASYDRGAMDQLVHDVMATSAAPVTTSDQPGASQIVIPKAHQPLPFPVILPQRRPRKKARGFVRAYAPVLDNCGINQETFLAFLKSFHKASQASPIFPIIQISAAIAGFAPSVIAMAVTTAVQVAAQTGAELQSRSRTNNFLDRMNDELFKPHGLYAMIIKYKSDAEVQRAAEGPRGLLSSLIKPQQVDLSTNQTIAKYIRTTSDDSSASGGHDMRGKMKQLRLASDTTKGRLELPEAAPLIFPDIDDKIQHEGPETFKDKTKDAKKFLADYLDRRAQMHYAQQDPNSALAVPESQRGFASKLADPNHPMYSGGLISLLSGGKVGSRPSKLEELRERRLQKDTRRIERGREYDSKREGKRVRRFGDDYLEELSSRTAGRGRFGGRGGFAGRGRGGLLDQLAGASSGSAHGRGIAGSQEAHAEAGSSSRTGHDRRRGGRRGRGGAGGAVKRLMQEDVLYLMIVNMPSEAELAEARQELGMARS